MSMYIYPFYEEKEDNSKLRISDFVYRGYQRWQIAHRKKSVLVHTMYKYLHIYLPIKFQNLSSHHHEATNPQRLYPNDIPIMYSSHLFIHQYLHTSLSYIQSIYSNPHQLRYSIHALQIRRILNQICHLFIFPTPNPIIIPKHKTLEEN